MRRFLFSLIALYSLNAMASETLEVATLGDVKVPYVLNIKDNTTPQYVFILFPGANGRVDPKIDENGQLTYKKRRNFLLRARTHLMDYGVATVATNSTSEHDKVDCLITDLKKRFPQAPIYLVGTSRGTFDTMKLAPYLQDKIAGVIHTASREEIVDFDTRGLHNRQLIVHHRDDACHTTPFAHAKLNAEKYGTDFIVMEGGISKGDECQALAHHGFNGVEAETVAKIMQWVEKKP